MKKASLLLVWAVSISGGCANTSPAPRVLATITQSTATVLPGLTGQFTATISNNSGVIWSVSCPASQCGSVSPAATASGSPTTYTAPPAPTSNLAVTVTATSATNSTITASASITVPAMSVAITPPSATTPLKGTQVFTATVANDSSNKGVNWTLTQGGTACSPGCGTIAPATTSSGSVTTYTAPASMPANSNVSVVATSAADSNISAPAVITITAPGVVTVTPSTGTVLPGLTGQFTATISNNSGVIWSVSCPASQCGSVSPAATSSGSPTTYTAPSAPASNLAVTVTATSATNSTITASASVTVPAMSVAVTPPSATTPLKGTQAFTATVANDSSNKGVNWTLMQGGTACSPGCGTIAPASTPSGSATTYTAPAVMPANSNVSVVAASAADSNVSAPAAITITASVAATVTPSTATVLPGLTGQFTATISNNSGVIWSVSCSASQCGGVSPVATSSGSPTTYTAPSALASNLVVTVTATSATDSTITASASITVPAMSVAITPPSAAIPLKGTQVFTATVANDSSNKGVNWTLTQGGTACSPGCGTIAPASTSSGSATTYTAPASMPANSSVSVVATSAADSNIAASATVTIAGITVSISPSTASVPAGATQQFTATVNNDTTNSGTTWTLTQAGQPCSPTCGTISPTTTTSGVATVYTAPATAPTTAQVTVRATSIADSAASASAIATIVAPISVSMSPGRASVLTGGTQQFTATVTNDSANNGVTWSLTQNGASCSPGCGTMSPATTTTGNPTTYTAPTSVPVPAAVTVIATSVTDSTKSASGLITVTGPCGTGKESLLKGQYAFLLQGFDASGPVAIGGSFDADGAGNLASTVGVEDINRASGPQTGLAILPAGSSYSVGSDNRGCMTLVNSAGTTTTFRLVLGAVAGTPAVASKGRILEFDDATGTGTRAIGQIRLQNPASFSNAGFSGPYTFGFYGQDVGQFRFAVAGTLTSDGNGSITGGTFDSDEGGTLASNTPVNSGTYSVGPNGHGTLGITAIGVTNHFAVYMINSSDAFFVSTDNLNIDPIFSGEAVGSAATFTSSSLNGSAVFHLTGNGSKPFVLLALAAADGLGNLSSFQVFQDNAGTVTSQTITTGTYSVAPNGRVTFTGLGTNPPVLYLSGQNTGFAVGTGQFSEIGMLEPQVPGPFSNASFSGAYLFATEIPGGPFVLLETGAAIAQGSAGTGTGTSDRDDTGGALLPNQSFSFTFSFASDGTGNAGPGTTAIIISPSKLVYFENAQTSPRVTVVEQ